MSIRRILSLWFPRLAAERLLRRKRLALPQPFAVLRDEKGAQILAALNAEAEALGLRPGQPLRDATAMCPELLTAISDPVAEAQFLTRLRRWSGKFSPWVAEEAPDALVIDLTGCAHLFGGEEALLAEAVRDCADLGLTVRAGLADTRGAAWALARFAGMAPQGRPEGDAIAQEARATRSKAARRPPGAPPLRLAQGVIAPPGGARAALDPLPLAALRLAPEVIEALHRLGLRRAGEAFDLPRAPFARRFGSDSLRRLDQALGLEPEPVAPARAPLHFATRLTLPDPIGLTEDLIAALDRLLPPLCAKLKSAGRGARRLRLEAWRADGQIERLDLGLARPTDDPAAMRPLLLLRLDRIDPGFGIDAMRLEVTESEPLHAVQHRGQLAASAAATQRQEGALHGLADLIGRLGARLGTDAVTRLHPAESHIPERSAQILTAAWSDPHPAPWPASPTPRPLMLWPSEALVAPDDPTPPAHFRWRRRDLTTRVAAGPERIAPEWWLDDPDWRSGPRDYWRVEIEGGERIWLYFAHGGDVPGGWFCHGRFG
jgi:protein ImuB